MKLEITGLKIVADILVRGDDGKVITPTTATTYVSQAGFGASLAAVVAKIEADVAKQLPASPPAPAPPVPGATPPLDKP